MWTHVVSNARSLKPTLALCCHRGPASNTSRPRRLGSALGGDVSLSEACIDVMKPAVYQAAEKSSLSWN
jgi:hypothetical protein